MSKASVNYRQYCVAIPYGPKAIETANRQRKSRLFNYLKERERKIKNNFREITSRIKKDNSQFYQGYFVYAKKNS